MDPPVVPRRNKSATRDQRGTFNQMGGYHSAVLEMQKITSGAACHDLKLKQAIRQHVCVQAIRQHARNFSFAAIHLLSHPWLPQNTHAPLFARSSYCRKTEMECVPSAHERQPLVKLGAHLAICPWYFSGIFNSLTNTILGRTGHI